jgi:hypothetical protein
MDFLGQRIEIFKNCKTNTKLSCHLSGKNIFLLIMHLLVNFMVLNNPVSVNSKNLNTNNSEYAIYRSIRTVDTQASPGNNSASRSPNSLSSEYVENDDSSILKDFSSTAILRTTSQNTTRPPRRTHRTTTKLPRHHSIGRSGIGGGGSDTQNNTSGFYIMVFVVMFFIVLMVIVGRVINSANDVPVDNAYLKYHRNSVAIAALSQVTD